jgi:protein TonB
VEANVAEPVAEPAAAEAAAAAAETETAAAGGEGGGVAPFPAWQMSSNTGAHGFHHQVSQALPVYTPEPPILRGDFPETARGKEVVMVVVINEEGAIAAFKVVQGVGNGVERTIVETLKRWVYVPAKFNGRAIASQQELRFHFPG